MRNAAAEMKDTRLDELQGERSAFVRAIDPDMAAEQTILELTMMSRSNLHGAFERSLTEILWLSQDLKRLQEDVARLYKSLNIAPLKRETILEVRLENKQSVRLV
jgi:hypothetical protein